MITNKPSDSNPVINIALLFGSMSDLAKAAERDLSRVYRWAYEGSIPTKAMKEIMYVAGTRGIDLRAQDFFDPSRLAAKLAQETEAAE